MGPLFQSKQTVVVTIDNKRFPTSNFFLAKISGLFVDEGVTKNIAVNSNFLSGQVSLDFRHLARDAGVSDEKEFALLEFEHPSQMLEIASSLILQGLVKLKKDGVAHEVYVMYSTEMHISFYNNMFGWNFYWTPKIQKFKQPQHHMYEIGEQCTLIALAK